MSCIQGRERRRDAAAGRHSKQAARVIWREGDDAVAIPGASFARRRITDRRGRAAVRIDRLQLALCEEADETVIWRPEWKRRFIGAGQVPTQLRVEPTHPQLRPLIFFESNEGNGAAIVRRGEVWRRL